MSVLNSGKFSTIRTLNTPFFPLFLGFPLGICYNSFIASQFWIFFLALPIFNHYFFSLHFRCGSFYWHIFKLTDFFSSVCWSRLSLRSSLLFSSDSEAVYFSPQTQKQSTFSSDSEAVYFSPQTQKQSTFSSDSEAVYFWVHQGNFCYRMKKIVFLGNCS